MINYASTGGEIQMFCFLFKWNERYGKTALILRKTIFHYHTPKRIQKFILNSQLTLYKGGKNKFPSTLLGSWLISPIMKD